jgi:C_GCAxxG_C_C family probable redox protein
MDRARIIDDVRRKAGGCFQRGEFYCSESVVHTLNEFLGWQFDRSVVRLAAGFPVGIGKSGCVCGAISGGVMVLGMVYGRDPGKTMDSRMFPVAAELHNHIKELYKSTCCRVITKDLVFNSPERKAHCVKITGEVAAWLADKLLDDEALKEKIQPVEL